MLSAKKSFCEEFFGSRLHCCY